MDTLDSFVSSSRPPPEPEVVSKEIKDRGSVFIAHIYKASSQAEALRAHSYLKNVVHGQKKQAEHEIYAWRCMVPKHGKTGLGGPDDFEVKSGSKDDGERFAGARVLKVMEAEGVIDAVVVVTRWSVLAALQPLLFSCISFAHNLYNAHCLCVFPIGLEGNYWALFGSTILTTAPEKSAARFE